MWLVIVLLAASGPAQRDARLSRAIRQYEAASFEAARDALLELVDAPNVSSADRAQVHLYLAASYLALSDPGSARHQLRTLAREQPNARPSPAAFRPDLVKLANEVWAEEEKRRAPPPEPAKPVEKAEKVERVEHAEKRATSPVVEAVEPPRPAPLVPASRPSRALAFVPFGVGQFARGAALPGALFLVAELALFAASAITLGMLESMKLPGPDRRPFVEGAIDPARRGEADVLNRVYPVTFFAGLAVLIAGVVEANLSWPSEASR